MLLIRVLLALYTIIPFSFRAQAMNEQPAVVQPRAMPASLPSQPAAVSSRAMPELPRMDDHHGDDQVRTFCTEGTPMNFLSTATSMNELNKVMSYYNRLFLSCFMLGSFQIFCVSFCELTLGQ